MTNSIYVALDFPNWQETSTFLERNDLKGVPVKVGMELFYNEGLKVIEKLKKDNHRIFLDLKLHDIPTTVMKAMHVLSKLEVDIVNIHALGGSEMIQRAKEGLRNGNPDYDTQLIAVTILTSMDEHMLHHELKLTDNVTETAVHFSKLASDNGADGVVCSVHEAIAIKKACGEKFLTVTPGIRLANTKADDQKRIATPGFARQNGADYLVIGRSITKSNHPRENYEQAVREWEEASCN